MLERRKLTSGWLGKATEMEAPGWPVVVNSEIRGLIFDLWSSRALVHDPNSMMIPSNYKLVV